MQTITVPTKTYQSLLEKARTFDRVLALTKQSFPIDEYSSSDLRQFKKDDRLNSKQKQMILAVIKKKSSDKI